jgi:hypothetical protein
LWLKFSGFAFPIPAMTCDVGDMRALRANPTRPFSSFCCKQSNFRKSTLGPPLRHAWVAKPNPNQAEGCNRFMFCLNADG